MVDYAARAEVRAAVEDYLFDRATAFAFDERLQSIQTDDETVRLVVSQLWFIYDDVKDHSVVADKPTWDWVQRLLLLLDSGAEVSFSSRRLYHVSQLVALATLIALAVAYYLHPEIWLPPVLLAGCVSILLARWRARVVDSMTESDPWRCHPFPTLGSLREAWERVGSFRKQRYRREVAMRRIRSGAEGRAVAFQAYFGWLFYSPLVLLFQLRPCRVETPHVMWR